MKHHPRSISCKSGRKFLRFSLLVMILFGIPALCAAQRSPFSHKSTRSGPSETRKVDRKNERAQPSKPSQPQRPSDRTGGTTVNRYRPNESPTRDTSTSRTRRPDDRCRDNDFERIGERNSTRSSHSYQPDAVKHYRGGYYRPSYRGWNPPHRQSGFYYYTWPQKIEPCRFGYYVWDYDPSYACKSLYYHYGYSPYVYRNRTVVASIPRVVYVDDRVTYRDYSDDYYLDDARTESFESTLDDIKRAWLLNRPELIEKHLDVDRRIAVFLDGNYSYSVDGSDYLDMTRDALDRIRTISIKFQDVRRRGDGGITAYGAHTYRAVDGSIGTAYMSFTLEKYSREWIITEAGSSKRPLR